MKITTRYLALAALGISPFVTSALADKVKFQDLPIAIRDKVQAYSGTARIEDVDRNTKNGKTTYEVAFKEEGKNKELLFNQDGQLLNPDGTPLDTRKITFNDLPQAVKKTLKSRMADIEAQDVSRQVSNGQVNYLVAFPNAGNRQEILLSPDGKILRDSRVSASAVAAAAASSGTRNSAVTKQAPLSASEKVAFDTLPVPVKRAITSAAKGARIEDVERGTWHGLTIYQAAFKDNGQNIELQVSENGRIYFDPRNTSVGRPAATASGRNASLYPNVTASVPLSASQKIERSAVPAAVERTIQERAGGNRIEDLERGNWNGKQVYEAAFHDNGKLVELQVDQDGNVVYDPRNK